MYNSSIKARALCPQQASTERHRFIVGTCSLHDNNELSVLQYSEDSNHVDSSGIYPHPDQVWAVESSPKDTQLVITSRLAHDCSKAITLWRMQNQTPEDIESDAITGYSNDQQELTEVTTFNQNQKASTISCVKWHKIKDKLLTVDANILTQWDIAGEKISVSASTDFPVQSDVIMLAILIVLNIIISYMLHE